MILRNSITVTPNISVSITCNMTAMRAFSIQAEETERARDSHGYTRTIPKTTATFEN